MPFIPESDLLIVGRGDDSFKTTVQSFLDLVPNNTVVGENAPADPEVGDFWYDTTEEQLKVFTNPDWEDTTQTDQFITDAPTDNQQYARQNGGWVVVEAGDGGGGGGDGATGTQTTELFGSAKAYGTVDAAGIGRGLFNATVTFNAAGSVSVNFINPLPADTYTVTSSCLNLTVSNKTTDGFLINTFDPQGAQAALEFDFAVHNDVPILVESTANVAAWGSFSDLGILGANLNIASVLRHPGRDTGWYDITFTRPMPSANYSVTVSTGADNAVQSQVVSKTTNGFEIITRSDVAAGTLIDSACDFAVHALNALPPTGTTGADAWCSAGAAGGIRSSFNVDTVTFTAPNTYDVTFINPMPSANYAVVGSAQILPNGTVSNFSVGAQTVDGFTYFLNDTSNNGAQQSENAFFAVYATNARIPFTVTQEQIEAAIRNPGVSAWGVVDGGTGDPNGPGLNFTSTRTGVGLYEITFTNPLPSDDYSVVVTSNNTGTKGSVGAKTADTLQIAMVDDGGNLANAGFNFVVCATNALPPRGGTGADAFCSFNGANGNNFSNFNATATRTNVGFYQVTFDTPMPSAEYTIVATAQDANIQTNINIGQATADGFELSAATVGAAPALIDPAAIHVVVHATNAQLPDTFTVAQFRALEARIEALEAG